MNFRKSKTYKNLQNAFSSECSSCGRYLIYSEIARENGYEQIGEVLERIASNERKHAELWLKKATGDKLPTTLANLKNAAYVLNKERFKEYKNYIKTAHLEGYNDIADLFDSILKIENNNGLRLQRLFQCMTEDKVFCKDSENKWLCLNCGNECVGMCAPKKCPVCLCPQSYYKPLGEI